MLCLRSSLLLFWLYGISGQCDVISHLPGQAFTYRSKSCGLTGFPDGVPWNITWVDVSDNSIENLTTPDGFPKLLTFSANDNLLTEFPNLTSFKDTLRTLALSRNKISYIDPDLLAPLVKLYSLNLYYNLLTTIPDVAGPILGSLNLERNQFIIFPPLTDLGRLLISFNMRNNMITSVPSNNTFPNIRSMLVTNQVDTINITSNTMLPLITYLELNSKLSEFPDLYWIGDTLTRLELSSNLIDHIPKDALNMLVNLNRFVMHNNRLTEFPDCTPFADTLTYLQVSTNSITYIPQRLVDVLSVIQFLNIGSNRLTRLPDFGQIADTLVTLHIHDNPLDDVTEKVSTVLETLASPVFDIGLSLLKISNAPSSLCEGKTFRYIRF